MVQSLRETIRANRQQAWLKTNLASGWRHRPGVAAPVRMPPLAWWVARWLKFTGRP